MTRKHLGQLAAEAAYALLFYCAMMGSIIGFIGAGGIQVYLFESNPHAPLPAIWTLVGFIVLFFLSAPIALIHGAMAIAAIAIAVIGAITTIFYIDSLSPRATWLMFTILVGCMAVSIRSFVFIVHPRDR